MGGGKAGAVSEGVEHQTQESDCRFLRSQCCRRIKFWSQRRALAGDRRHPHQHDGDDGECRRIARSAFLRCGARVGQPLDVVHGRGHTAAVRLPQRNPRRKVQEPSKDCFEAGLRRIIDAPLVDGRPIVRLTRRSSSHLMLQWFPNLSNMRALAEWGLRRCGQVPVNRQFAGKCGDTTTNSRMWVGHQSRA